MCAASRISSKLISILHGENACFPARPHACCHRPEDKAKCNKRAAARAGLQWRSMQCDLLIRAEFPTGSELMLRLG